jgi:pimeloyl-ACP methyl ester carboxylesterase
MFKTAAGQARYFAAYDATLALWPVLVESSDVPTRFGRTHVHTCGSPDAPPLLLLPGQAISSTMWYPNIAALSRAFRVYALDILGDMGKSVSARPMRQPGDFAAWLTDLLDELRLETAHVAGLSYGGFIALRLALAAPGRVRKLVLMAPASLLPMRPQFFMRMAAVFLPAFVLSLEAKQALLLGVYSRQAAPAIKQMLTSTDFRYTMYLPPVVTDAELRGITTPTLLLLGDREVVYNYMAVLKRARKYLPRVKTEIIHGAGHALNFDDPERVNTSVVAFLSEDARPQ